MAKRSFLVFGHFGIFLVLETLASGPIKSLVGIVGDCDSLHW